jgi:hypothetical protein
VQKPHILGYLYFPGARLHRRAFLIEMPNQLFTGQLHGGAKVDEASKKEMRSPEEMEMGEEREREREREREK